MCLQSKSTYLYTSYNSIDVPKSDPKSDPKS